MKKPKFKEGDIVRCKFLQLYYESYGLNDGNYLKIVGNGTWEVILGKINIVYPCVLDNNKGTQLLYIKEEDLEFSDPVLDFFSKS